MNEIPSTFSNEINLYGITCRLNQSSISVWYNAPQFVSVCVGSTQPISFSVLVLNPRKRLRTISPARPEVEEGRKVPEKTERASWQSRAEETSSSPGKDDRRKEAVREDSQRWVNILCSLVEVSRKIHHPIVYKCRKSCSNALHRLPFLALGADPSPRLFVCSSFFHPLGCICVAVKKCVIPLVRNEKKH